MKKKQSLAGVLIALVAIISIASPAQAQQKSAQDAINEYRQSLQDGNPADLNAARGEGIWNAKRGGKSLAESCDLGLGIGKVKGAVAQLPKYFDDVKKVMDIESRLVHCMVTFQGAKQADFTPRHCLQRRRPARYDDRRPCGIRLRRNARHGY